jgi:hypothetical protein
VKAKKVEARVSDLAHARYDQARETLRLEDMSDFVRRACDDLAGVTLAKAAGRDLERKQVTPRPRGGG